MSNVHGTSRTDWLRLSGKSPENHVCCFGERTLVVVERKSGRREEANGVDVSALDPAPLHRQVDLLLLSQPIKSLLALAGKQRRVVHIKASE